MILVKCNNCIHWAVVANKREDLPFIMVAHKENRPDKKHVFIIEDKEENKMIVCDFCDFKNPDCSPCNICERDCCSNHGHLVRGNEICCDECYEEIIEEDKK